MYEPHYEEESGGGGFVLGLLCGAALGEWDLIGLRCISIRDKTVNGNQPKANSKTPQEPDNRCFRNLILSCG